MASRVVAFRRFYSLVAVPRPAVVSPSTACLSRWAHTAPASSNWQQVPFQATTSRPRPQWQKTGVFFNRHYSEEDVMSLSELKENVLNVLRLFDKVNPDKVRVLCHCFVF
jgi:hypothetical protein